MKTAKNSGHAASVPAVGDRYSHPSGEYEVDWICVFGDHDGGEICIGLCGKGLTWTGLLEQLKCEGFKKLNANNQHGS